jgi:hypothetical protein
VIAAIVGARGAVERRAQNRRMRDPAHQWMRALIRRLFGRTPPTQPWKASAGDP